MRTGIRICVAAYLVTGALAYSDFTSLRFLLPLPILALIHFHDSPEPAQDSPLATLPPVAREISAMVLALLGSGMIVAAFDDLEIHSAFDINYLQLWIGLMGYGAAVVLLVTSCSRRAGVSLAISSYVAILALFGAGLVVETAIGPRTAVTDRNLVLLVVIAMLLVQAWRHFGRDGGWLKIVEGAIGGIIVALAAAFAFDTLYGLGHWAPLVGIFYVPFIAVAAALIYLGMRMIWSDELHLGRFFRSRA